MASNNTTRGVDFGLVYVFNEKTQNWEFCGACPVIPRLSDDDHIAMVLDQKQDEILTSVPLIHTLSSKDASKLEYCKVVTLLGLWGLEKLLKKFVMNGLYMTCDSEDLTLIHTICGKTYLSYMLVLFYSHGAYIFDCEVVVVPDTANPNKSVVSLKFPWLCNDSETPIPI